ncbi:MAG: alanine racemase, partial [Burkholderiales bacterium]|nr:alanine racemase [Burkholderiales bacterium]
MSRPIEAVIDKNAFLHNLGILREKAGKRFMWAVVKADAYGHGMLNLLDVCTGADGIALLDVSEAIAAREQGWARSILLIEGFFDPQDLPEIDKQAFEIVVHSQWQIDELKAYKAINVIKVHLKVNSGMNRLGFPPEKVEDALKQLREIPYVEVSDIVTHFANAESSYPKTGVLPVVKQLERLKDLPDDMKKCFSNTGAVLWHDVGEECAVRVGIAMYGISPDMNVTSKELNIIPVMTFKAGVLAIQDLKVGEAVGYGSKFVATRPTKIAVIACGYADGYPRQQVENRYVLINGKRAPLVGAVSMDMITADITDIPGVKEGDWAALWGKGLPVNEVAAAPVTIGFEV